MHNEKIQSEQEESDDSLAFSETKKITFKKEKLEKSEAPRKKKEPKKIELKYRFRNNTVKYSKLIINFQVNLPHLP